MSSKGRFIWYDYMAKDVAAAKAFYTAVCGWTLTPFNDDYAMWTGSDGPLGGVVPLPEDAAAQGWPAHWIAYIGVDDLEATVAKAVELGACQMGDYHEMPNVGRWAVLADPHGAVFAPFKPAQAGEAPTEPSHPMGCVSWHELMANDREEAWAFYEALFGWVKFDAIDMGDDGVYQLLGQKWPTAGMMTKPAEAPQASWSNYVRVADLDASIETVKRMGGTLVHGPMEVPGGNRVAMCLDPQGGWFGLDSEAKAQEASGA